MGKTITDIIAIIIGLVILAFFLLISWGAGEEIKSKLNINKNEEKNKYKWISSLLIGVLAVYLFLWLFNGCGGADEPDWHRRP